MTIPSPVGTLVTLTYTPGPATDLYLPFHDGDIRLYCHGGGGGGYWGGGGGRGGGGGSTWRDPGFTSVDSPNGSGPGFGPTGAPGYIVLTMDYLGDWVPPTALSAARIAARTIAAGT